MHVHHLPYGLDGSPCCLQVVETRAGRTAAADRKELRAEAEARKRDRLKAAFVKKQLELAKAKQRAKQGGDAGQAAS